MRNYLFGSGLFAAVTSGIALLRGSKDTPITWRALLAWLSWGITLALAIGAIVDMRRDSRGVAVAPDSPVAAAQIKRAKKEAKRVTKAER
ncbi:MULTISPECIES: hypothetical protein [Bacteria]|uniref:hypothetical protein n=1 Tax=Bacteria TaxID=2 RepID=UPI003C7E3E54